MSESLGTFSACSGTEATITYKKWPRDPVATRDLFDVLVYGANKFELVPRTELAKSLLAMWLCGDLKKSLQMLPNHNAKASDYHFGGDVTGMEFTFSGKPLLADGVDAYMSGIHLLPDEVAACKALVQRMRDKRMRERLATVKASSGGAVKSGRRLAAKPKKKQSKVGA